jgi:hypothetical protein
LGLTLIDLGRLEGPTVIRSIAITGSDSYFQTGTDGSVLFETSQPETLAALLRTQIDAASAKQPGIESQKGTVHGLSYQSVKSPDRQVCSYVARLDSVVVVTNSLAQLDKLASVSKSGEPIASLDEFKCFRQRYPLGDTNETALVFLSDATIRC